MLIQTILKSRRVVNKMCNNITILAPDINFKMTKHRCTSRPKIKLQVFSTIESINSTLTLTLVSLHVKYAACQNCQLNKQKP